MNSMRRLTRTIIRSLALGALTTVGIAWAIHLAASPVNRRADVLYRRRAPERGESAGFLTAERIRAPGKVWLKLLIVHPSPNDPAEVKDTLTAAMPWWEQHLCTPWNSRGWPMDKYDRAYVTGAGWPFLALWHEYLYNPALDQPPTFLFLNQHPPAHAFDTPGAFKLGMFTRDFGAGVAIMKVPGSLPYRPVVVGFVLNTLLFAVVWSVVLVVPGCLRRRSRRRRGACIKCGYDLSGVAEGAPCPECGAEGQFTGHSSQIT
jgi:hypothetical protein